MVNGGGGPGPPGIQKKLKILVYFLSEFRENNALKTNFWAFVKPKKISGTNFFAQVEGDHPHPAPDPFHTLALEGYGSLIQSSSSRC